MLHSKSLGGGLFELRALESNNIARTIYIYQKK
ncbi:MULTISPECIES: type II toxin-antitoxin system RelE/ParE family toxin [unclassified Gilliamella]|nr:type II toxin-antitoxin system RelE/ParE family toxin [Gilliamella apicola]